MCNVEGICLEAYANNVKCIPILVVTLLTAAGSH